MLQIFRFYILFFFLLNHSSAAELQPNFSGNDRNRTKIPIRLQKVLEGFNQVTDLAFVPSMPGMKDTLFVLEKTGSVWWVSLKEKKPHELVKIPVATESELGLLGIAFHPQFDKNQRVFLNTTIESARKLYTQISEWKIHKSSSPQRLEMTLLKVLLEVEQPYANHNAGQLAFGPDGFLYIGFGDGGSAGDPHRHGQNLQSLLGKMLRIDVDTAGTGQPYTIPKDNPFIDKPGIRPEIWAWGLRNPWRYSFDPSGRLIVADVGQNNFEEISIVEKGKNYGWNVREGFHCYPVKVPCPPSSEKFEDPILEYGRQDGISITGGYVYLGKAIPRLKNHYVFADFGSNRIWAILLPKNQRPQKKIEMLALGQWPIEIATFARDEAGEIYTADFGGSGIYRLSPK